MSKRNRPKHSRGATRSPSQPTRSLERIGNEGILSRGDVERGLRGVGFAHKLTLSTDLAIDRDLLKHIGIDEGEPAPYQVPKPRHITSIPHLSLDEYALRFLNLGRETTEFLSSLKAECQKMDEAISKKISCRVAEVHEIEGRRVIAEVDNMRVSKIRGGIRAMFEQAGVAIPEVYAPHIVIGHADTFKDQHRIANAASEIMVGGFVVVEDVSIYTQTYTELERPVGTIPIE